MGRRIDALGPMTRPLAIFTALLTLALASCSSSSKSPNRASSTTTTAAARANDPAYADPGPYPVGMTTLNLPDRKVWVWYPADEAAVAGKTKYSYDQATPLPDNLKGVVPPKYDNVVHTNAYAGVKGSSKGPFPVVLFAHGLSAYPLVNSTSEIGIASWGFVVVSIDYIERDIVNEIVRKKYPLDPGRDPRLMLASLDLVAKASADPASLLHGTVDATKVGAVGHSLGGPGAFAVLQSPRVAVAIGYAPYATNPDPPPNKPTMLIGGALDNAVPAAMVAKTYDSLVPPKRRIEIANAGHNTFTDTCQVIRAGGGMIQFAIANHLVDKRLADLGFNGCNKNDLDPDLFLRVVQHFTVAELRAALRIDPQPVGLGDGIVHAFPGVSITYTHEP
jgi:predicted dienelactone hydrolase